MPRSRAAAPVQIAPAKGKSARSFTSALTGSVSTGPVRLRRPIHSSGGSALLISITVCGATPCSTPAAGIGTSVSSATTTRSGRVMMPRSWIGPCDARTYAKIGAPRRSAP